MTDLLVAAGICAAFFAVVLLAYGVSFAIQDRKHARRVLASFDHHIAARQARIDMTEHGTRFTVDSKRWMVRRGPVWWNRWLLAHDPERRARIEAARTQYRLTHDVDALRTWFDA